jgi:MFS family permease
LSAASEIADESVFKYASLIFCYVCTDRSNLSTAIIPMAAAFQWDSFFSGLVLSSFWAGYALTQILGGKLADKYGGQFSFSQVFMRTVRFEVIVF